MARKKNPSISNDPNHAREMIKLLTIRVNQGHPTSVESIVRWLEQFPELKSENHALNSLADKAVAAWVKAVGFGDPLAEIAAQNDAAELKAELLGHAPSMLDKVLASAVIVATLSHNRAVQVAAQPTQHPGMREARDRILSKAQKRLVEAIKAWQLLDRKKDKGLQPKGKLAIFDPAA